MYPIDPRFAEAFAQYAKALGGSPVLKDETQLLCDLWHGDPDSTGYHAEALVIQACRLEQPASVLAAIAIFYPGEKTEDINLEDRTMIDRGFQLWKQLEELDRKRLASRHRKSLKS